MKKKFKSYQLVTMALAGSIVALLLVCFCAGEALAFTNIQLFDTTWSFERAIISLPESGGYKYFYVEGAVESWKDFEGSDMIQVRIDGVTYLTHSSNVILISE